MELATNLEAAYSIINRTAAENIRYPAHPELSKKAHFLASNGKGYTLWMPLVRISSIGTRSEGIRAS